MKFFIVFAILTQCILANPLEGLSQNDIKAIESGEYLFKNKPVKNKPWPEITVYKTIDATSLESVAVFYALEHQPNYVPNLLKAQVVAQRVPTEADVRYELKMPWPLKNGKYIHGHKLTYDKPSTYKVSWWLVKSNTAKEVKGSATFYNYKNKTLLKYNSFVVPDSFLASFVETKMLEDVKASLISIHNEIIRVKKKDRNLMRNFVNKIDATLSGKFTYLTKKNN
jgi:hypothetical protein